MGRLNFNFFIEQFLRRLRFLLSMRVFKGFRPYSEGFYPGSLVFLPPQKPTLNFNSIWIERAKNYAVDVPTQIPIILFIIMFLR